MSLTPSPFKSPMFTTEYPKLSSSISVGPFVVESLISTTPDMLYGSFATNHGRASVKELSP